MATHDFQYYLEETQPESYTHLSFLMENKNTYI